jgi:L-ascorbate metabolism protein UlaG (beta-lactamase superfamily)
MNTKVQVTRLSWAGIRVDVNDQRLIIDAIEGRNGEVQSHLGAPLKPLVPIASDDKRVDIAVLTHLHPDHYDLDALRRNLSSGGKVVVPAAAAPDLAGTGLNVLGVEDFASVQLGQFRLTALPAVDGFGWVQSSWLIECQGLRVFHGGDTLFHGYWWKIVQKLGSPDFAFLPINGARIAIPGIDATGLPAVMTAEQAAVAGRMLKARHVVPIHYEEFDSPPVYQPDPDAETSFFTHASRQGVAARLITAGQQVIAA